MRRVQWCSCGDRGEFATFSEEEFQFVAETKPTCTEPAARTYFCKTCGEAVRETIEPLGHLWGAWDVATSPTCTEEGYQKHTCERCGYCEEVVTEPIGHLLIARKKSKTVKGMNEGMCIHCGQIAYEPCSKMPKRIAIAAVFLAFVMCLVFSVWKFALPYFQYSQALEMIENGNHNEAYAQLEALGDYKDCKELLKNFEVVYLTEMTYEYEFSQEHLIETDVEGRTVRELWYSYYEVNNPSKFEDIYEYDEYGNMTYCVNYDENGVNYELTYDDYGNVILEVYYNDDGEITYKTECEYEYDENENIIRKVSHYDESKQTRIEEYEYDANGNKIRWAMSEGDANGNVVYTGDCQYVYDEKGNLICTIMTDEDGRVTGRDKMEYDEKGNKLSSVQTYYDDDGNVTLMREVEYDVFGNLLSNLSVQYYEYRNEMYRDESRCEYEYDERGNIVLYLSYDENGEVTRKYAYEREYDEKGNVVLEVTYNKDGEIVSEKHYEYKYDEFGTLILKVEYNADGEMLEKTEYSNPVYVYRTNHE